MKPKNEGLIQIIEGEEYQRFKIQKLRKRIKKEKKLINLISLAGYSCFGSSLTLNALKVIGMDYALSLFAMGVVLQMYSLIPSGSIRYKNLELKEREKELEELNKSKNYGYQNETGK